MNIIRSLILATAAFSIGSASFAQTASLPDTGSVNEWIKSREWAPGLPFKLSGSVNKPVFYEQYMANTDNWNKAFDFLRNKQLPEMPPGRYPISGTDVFAIITEAPSRTFEQSGWESHKSYIDLQHVIRGKEKIGVSSAAHAQVTQAYDSSQDVAHYTADGKFYTASPEEFFLFFPDDAHRPNIKVEGFDSVKKVVIKIRFVPAAH